MRLSNAEQAKFASFQAERPAVEAKRQVDSKYASHVPSCIQITKKEAESYRDLLHKRTSDTIRESIPEFNSNNLPGVSSMWGLGNQAKIIEAENRYPDFLSGFKTLQNRFSVKTYSNQHQAYAESIRSSKNLQQADMYASQLQNWHNSLTNGFHIEVNNMLQKLDGQLKSVCQPPVMMPDHPIPIPQQAQPIGVPQGNAPLQPVQPGNEMAMLRQMVEDMRGQLQDMRGVIADSRDANNYLRTELATSRTENTGLRTELAARDTTITALTTENTTLRTENTTLQTTLAARDATIIDLTNRNTELAQEVATKNVTINNLTTALQQAQGAGN